MPITIPKAVFDAHCRQLLNYMGISVGMKLLYSYSSPALKTIALYFLSFLFLVSIGSNFSVFYAFILGFFDRCYLIAVEQANSFIFLLSNIANTIQS